VRVAGIVLVHDEDVWVERVVRNIAPFCDRVHVADHVSTDGTWEIVSGLARELENVEAVRISHAARSHDLVLPYVGTDTWVFSPDGDELFDPAGLQQLRGDLESGRYDDSFRIFPAMLHCVELDEQARVANGYLAPPALTGPKLFNFAALESWNRVYRERLHEGEPVFREGWAWTAVARLEQEHAWDDNPFRCLHTCFLRRSSLDSVDGNHARLNIAEANTYRRDLRGRIARAVRRDGARRAESWKLEKYRRGPVVTKDASAFLPPR
jgi:hypothetical protein